jgi:hypothetical protein
VRPEHSPIERRQAEALPIHRSIRLRIVMAPGVCARIVFNILIVGSLLTGTVGAGAHGNWPPKHGGLKNDDRGEVEFELVVRGERVVIYLEDHGEAMSTVGASGVLSFERGQSVWSTKIASGGKNLLAGRLPRPLKKGDRVVVDVNFRDGSIAKGGFLVK